MKIVFRMGITCLDSFVTIIAIDTGSGKKDGIHNRNSSF